MKGNTYGLLVGIDNYPSPIPQLRGCVNDVRGMEQYLQAWFESREPTDALRLKTLTNQEATRQAVIEGFHNHLGQAGQDDTALFCYSGHGSQEQAPEQFWPVEPDHLNETLVLYDSRSEGSWDLADKELSKLIAQISQGGAHVLVLLDCCHSGSGTRAPGWAETAVRRAPTDLRLRPPESFIVTPHEVVAAGVTRGLPAGSSGWHSSGRHVLLAACRDDEEAKEYQVGGLTHGAFSYFLLDTLRTMGGAINYRDLFSRAAALVQGQVQRQSPQLEATRSEDLSQPFLGGVIRPSRRSFIATHQKGHWIIDAGQVHGIPIPVRGDATELALFDFKASDDDLKDPTNGMGTARISNVLGTTSQLEIIEGDLNNADGPLKAVITRFPAPRLRVKLEGESLGTTRVREALVKSNFVRESSADEAADFRLVALSNQYLIARPDDDQPLIGQIDGYTDRSARQAVDRLEHIERWQATASLNNFASTIGPDELQVDILQNGKPLTGTEIRLEYRQGNGDEWINPEVMIRLKNTGDRTLFVGLLDLPQTFGIANLIGEVGCQRLDKNQEIFANKGDPISVTVPDDIWSQGIIELKDILKVIVSTTPFDARRLEQADLDLPRTRAANLGRLGVTSELSDLGTLDQLMERVQTRQMGLGPTKRIDDWRATQFVIKTIRPLASQRLDVGRGVTLTGNVRIEPHPALSAAAVRLTSMPAATRAVKAMASLPRMLYDDPRVVQPFDFSTSRATHDALNVLELSGVNDPTLVSPAQPLQVTIPQSLARGEHILPIGFDGEFFVPLGRAEALGDKTCVILERLPQPTEADNRTLGGALRILFQKVIARTFGTQYSYPILAAAEVGDDFSVRYEADPWAVQQKVAAASRIALFVHGIIGDTRDMAASLRRAGLADRYDLILTFDYENLQDSIGKTAGALKTRLESVGLGPGHSKSLDIVAHSMGGLVSRWFIERQEGNRVARKLVMLGTPNGGSPWPDVADWATTALTVGLNELSPVFWPASVLAGLTHLSGAAQVTLGEMTPGSNLLKELARNPAPGIPYFLVAGDTSLIPATTADEARMGKLRRLLARLWSDRTKYQLADLLFCGGPNDIAVSLESMQQIRLEQDQGCEATTVACDHISYFQDAQALTMLSRALHAS